MSDERVRVEITDGVADVRLARPEKRNALDPAMFEGLVHTGEQLKALGADLRIVAPDARLSVMEVKWGLIPDMTGTQVLPELVGRDVAKELTLTARVVSGTEAAALGLCTRTDPEPREAALALAREIAGRSPHAVRAAKRLIDVAGRVDLATGFAAEQTEIGALIGSPNQVEAVTAGFEKRAPVFTEVE